jgi:anthranilate synthase component 1
MIYPSLIEARGIAKKHSVLPVSFEMLSDVITPIALLLKLKEKSGKCYLLESVEGGEKWGRYSFLGFDPTLTVTLRNGEVRVQNGTATTRHTDDPNGVLRDILSAYDPPRMENLPPFTGGFVGYFSYDYIGYNEKSLHLTQNDPVGLDDFHLMLFEKVIVFDHLRQKLCIIVNVKSDGLDKNYRAAQEEIENIAKIIRSKEEIPNNPSCLLSDFKPLFSKEEYCEMVTRAKRHIVEGDIFQAVLSNRMEADFKGSLLSAYRVLRTVNPSPYMFYLGMEDTEIAGASPETLLSLRDGRLQTFPIAGTCPRGKTEEEDERFITALLADEKELSEHNMLVDLGRNDIGRISEFGSVKVSDYQKVMRFSHVSHITSRVTGKLREGLDPLHAVASLLPAGTLSGAPKIRACEIIDGLEGVKRGVYGGAIGYIDFAGNMDLCIAIRMALKKDGKVYVQAGAGIVADSVPEKEYEECISKARAMAGALRASGEVES